MIKATILTNEIDCEAHSTYRNRIERYLKANDIEVWDDFNVDIIIISTCGVTTKLFKMVATVLNYFKNRGFDENQIFIMGCLPKTHEEMLKKTSKAVLVPFGKEDILDSYLQAKHKFCTIKASNCITIPQKKHLTKTNQYFGIEIEEGCLRQCTFCVINRAHGAIKSKDQKELETQYRQAAFQGYDKISLFGTDTFAYGYDTNTNIVELIKSFNSIQGKLRYKLGTAHIRWIPQLYEGLEEIIDQIELMHPAIQHVDTNVLKRMGRGGCFEQAYSELKRLKNKNPNVLYLTDIIVGFPGEDEKAFEKLLNFFKKDKCFDYVNVFMYDDMEAAPSYRLDNKVSTAQKLLRYNQLNEVLKNRQSYDESVHSSNLIKSVIVDGVFHSNHTDLNES